MQNFVCDVFVTKILTCTYEKVAQTVKEKSRKNNEQRESKEKNGKTK